MTDEELQREYLENAVKEQRIREKKRKIRRIFFYIDIAIVAIMLIGILSFCHIANKTPQTVYDEETGQEIVTYFK